jgi:hypothetical protein
MKKIVTIFALLFFPAIAQSEIAVKINNTLSNRCTTFVFTIEGKISKNDLQIISGQIDKAKPRACPMPTFLLNSEGGDIQSALQIGRLVRKQEGIVNVNAGFKCLSSCVLILAGGVWRNIDEEAKIGIHRPYFEDLPDTLSLAEIRKRRDEITKDIEQYLKDMDISPRILELMLSIPPEKMLFLSKTEMQSLGFGEFDATYDEKIVASRAKFHFITSVEYRRRSSKIESHCDINNLKKLKRNFLYCRDSVLWDLSYDEFIKRYEDASIKCRSANTDECYRKIMSAK